jgi:molybdopterin-containing oxidoreductase family membrane subunit
MNTKTIPVIEEVRVAAVRPMTRSGWRFWALAAALAVLVGWGLVAYVVQLRYGLDSAGYNDRAFWGIYEANLVSFIGVSYGGALVSAILRLTNANWRAPITRMAEAMALFALLVGMAYAVVHLGRPERMWRIVINGEISSPIVWDFVAIMSYLIATLCFLYLPLIPDLAIVRDRFPEIGGARGWLYRTFSLDWRGLPEQRRVLVRAITTISIIIIPLAIAVHSVLSWAFAVTTRPGWDSTIFGPYFVVAALYSGVGMVILVVAAFRRAYHLEEQIAPEHFRRLAYLMIVLGLTYLYFTFTELLTEGYKATEELAPLLEALLIGRFATFFWLFVAAAGVLPVLLVAFPKTRTVRGIVVAAGLVVAGMWLKRILIVVPAATNPAIAGPWGDFKLTWVAVATTVAGAAAIPLLLMFFFKLVPILAIDEIEEIEAETEIEIWQPVPLVHAALGEEGAAI